MTSRERPHLVPRISALLFLGVASAASGQEIRSVHGTGPMDPPADPIRIVATLAPGKAVDFRVTRLVSAILDGESGEIAQLEAVFDVRVEALAPLTAPRGAEPAPQLFRFTVGAVAGSAEGFRESGQSCDGPFDSSVAPGAEQKKQSWGVRAVALGGARFTATLNAAGGATKLTGVDLARSALVRRWGEAARAEAESALSDDAAAALCRRVLGVFPGPVGELTTGWSWKNDLRWSCVVPAGVWPRTPGRWTHRVGEITDSAAEVLSELVGDTDAAGRFSVGTGVHLLSREDGLPLVSDVIVVGVDLALEGGVPAVIGESTRVERVRAASGGAAKPGKERATVRGFAWKPPAGTKVNYVVRTRSTTPPGPIGEPEIGVATRAEVRLEVLSATPEGGRRAAFRFGRTTGISRLWGSGIGTFDSAKPLPDEPRLRATAVEACALAGSSVEADISAAGEVTALRGIDAAREAALRRHPAAGDAAAVARACDDATVRGRIEDLLVPAPWELDGSDRPRWDLRTRTRFRILDAPVPIVWTTGIDDAGDGTATFAAAGAPAERLPQRCSIPAADLSGRVDLATGLVLRSSRSVSMKFPLMRVSRSSEGVTREEIEDVETSVVEVRRLDGPLSPVGPPKLPELPKKGAKR